MGNILFDRLERLLNELVFERGGAFRIIDEATSGVLGYLTVDATDDIGIFVVVDTVDVVGNVEAVEKEELLVTGDTLHIVVVIGILPANPGGGVGLLAGRPPVFMALPIVCFCGAVVELGEAGTVAAAATAASVVKAESA